MAEICDGREVAIEDERLRVELDRANHHVVELALAHDELGIDAIAQLHDGVDHLDARGARQLVQLGHALLDVVVVAARRLFADVDRGWRGRLWLRLSASAPPWRTRPRATT